MSSRQERREKIASLFQSKCGVSFRNPDLLLEAMTHSSAREPDFPPNERLEFLGDAILGLVVSEHLFRRFPERREGELSMAKSVLVSAGTLARASRRLGLDQIVLVGKGISAGKIPPSILADAFEAAIAAVYLDAGHEAAKDFVLKFLAGPLDDIQNSAGDENAKSMLQDYAQKHALPLPVYRVTRAIGPDHSKKFQVTVQVALKQYGPTWGRSKKEAEQKAARAALAELQGDAPR